MQLNTVAELEKFQGAEEGRGVIDVTVREGNNNFNTIMTLF